MDKKLTLKLDKNIIDRAKAYAKEHNQSLSRMVEAYFKMLTEEKTDQSEIEITGFVKSMSSDLSLDPERDYREELGEALEHKYT